MSVWHLNYFLIHFGVPPCPEGISPLGGPVLVDLGAAAAAEGSAAKQAEDGIEDGELARWNYGTQGFDWRFPKSWGYPQIIQDIPVMDDWVT